MTDATLQHFPAPTLADMRQALGGGKGSVTHCEGGAFVTLARDGVVWTLRITDPDSPVAHETCDRVATAVGAPSLDWRRESNGHTTEASWVEWIRGDGYGS
jgi:hypothetical protein